MAISLGNIFKKEKAASEQEKLAQQPTPSEKTSENKGAEEAKQTPPKHGESGVCCGSCN